MTAWLLRLWLATQLTTALLLAAWFDDHWGPYFPLAGSLAMGLILVGLLQPLIITCQFAIARLHGSPPPAAQRLTLWQAIRTLDAELDAAMRLFGWIMPFRNHQPVPQPAAPVQPVPLLFVHGYFCNHAIWRDFMDAAAARGYPCAAVDLEPVYADIDRYGAQIEAAAAGLLTRTGADQLVVIGHSMGGLAVRAWLRQYGTARVRHAITLGTPHGGTVLAYFAQTRNARQMRPGNDWLLHLAASEPPQLRSLFTSVWSWHDNLVAPQESARLDGAHHIDLSGLGHVRLVCDARVHALVFERIAAVTRATAVPPADKTVSDAAQSDAALL